MDIERTLLSHPLIKDVAILGIDDEVYGQTVGAVIVLNDSEGSERFSLQGVKNKRKLLKTKEWP